MVSAGSSLIISIAKTIIINSTYLVAVERGYAHFSHDFRDTSRCRRHIVIIDASVIYGRVEKVMAAQDAHQLEHHVRADGVSTVTQQHTEVMDFSEKKNTYIIRNVLIACLAGKQSI